MFKAQALNRVEGFHPDDSSTPSSSTTTAAANNGPPGDLFSTATPSGGGTMTTMSAHQHQQHHGFDLPYPFCKFPSSINVAAAANVEFNDEFTASTSNSISTRSSMRTQRQMKTPQRHTTCITFSTYLLPAQHLPLLQHFRHTFPHPPPPPMEGEQGVSQVAYTTATNNTRSFLPSLR